MQAARYQIIIMYFIALTTFSTILSLMHLTLNTCFDSRSMIQTSILKKRDKKPSILDMMVSFCRDLSKICCFNEVKRNSKTSSVVLDYDDESTYLAPKDKLSILTTASSIKDDGKSVVIAVDHLSYGFVVNDDRNLKNGESQTRILFEEVSFELYPGEMALVSGPSGVGKSTLLRIIAGLTEADGENIKLYGRTQESNFKMQSWRKRVRYVPQHKVDITGTPNDFIKTISQFIVWKDGNSPSLKAMQLATRRFASEWGMHQNLLDYEWKTLSGGESQRLLVAISLASLSSGDCILLDESTSALDIGTKVKVENSVRDHCSKLSAVAIWISHDPSQKDRLNFH